MFHSPSGKRDTRKFGSPNGINVGGDEIRDVEKESEKFNAYNNPLEGFSEWSAIDD